MTTYNLTINADTYDGGSSGDTFKGPAGGNDTLRGNGGNDLFEFQKGQTGLADGGIGTDQLHLIGTTYNELDANLKIVGIETLTVDASNLYATVDQLDSFTKFNINNNSDQFHLFLQGNGGSLNFSTSYTAPQQLTVDAEMADSAVKITGSAHNDWMQGSDFADTLFGVGGNDTIYGGAGNDMINGGLGKDYLYGDDGKDTFAFNTAPSASNVDHIGDFRYQDDSILLKKSIFHWAGQTSGEIKASEFKVIGTGGTQDANDHILYNAAKGSLYYDVDGAGGTKPVLIALLDNYSGDIPTVTYHDILLA